jgi:hypothetical protein
MTAYAPPCGSRSGNYRLTLALAAVLAAAQWTAGADGFPSLRQGLWEYQRTAGANKYAAKECLDPSEYLLGRQAAQERIGCRLSPIKRVGSTYTYGADCAVKLPSGAAMFSTTSVLTVDSDSAYRIETRTTSANGTSNESITAQRVADCVK